MIGNNSERDLSYVITEYVMGKKLQAYGIEESSASFTLFNGRNYVVINRRYEFILILIALLLLLHLLQSFFQKNWRRGTRNQQLNLGWSLALQRVDGTKFFIFFFFHRWYEKPLNSQMIYTKSRAFRQAKRKGKTSFSYRTPENQLNHN